ncbi:MAG: ABC transporter permease [Defluviitaleaceae bacterium]|nr:ABC transporter permease [Defluviitaleaceae bacterium]
MSAIFVTTWKEAVRRKTFLVMTAVTLLYLIFWAVMLHYYVKTANEQGLADAFTGLASHMITQMGLQFSSMLIALLTVMLGAGAISSEVESGVVLSIVTRPVRRFEYVLGKFLGLATLACVYATLLYGLILALGAVFQISTVTAMSFAQVAGGWGFYLLVPVAVLCLTVFGSTILKTVPNGLLVIFIYILGNVGGMVEMIGNYIASKSVVAAGIFVSLISPFNTLYGGMERKLLPSNGIVGELMRGASGLSGGGSPASWAMYVYIGVYMAGFLAWTVWRFHKKDIT